MVCLVGSSAFLAAPFSSSGSSGTALTGGDQSSISIILGAYNEHEYLERTVNAIFESTPLEILQEIILVDDASNPPMAPGSDLPHFTRVEGAEGAEGPAYAVQLGDQEEPELIEDTTLVRYRYRHVLDFKVLRNVGPAPGGIGNGNDARVGLIKSKIRGGKL